MDRRVERIEEYLHDALEQEDALIANLHAAASDLMLIRYQLMRVVKEAVDSDVIKTEDYVEELGAMISSMLLVDRQTVRYVQLGQQLSSAKAPRRGSSAGSRNGKSEDSAI